MPGLTSSQASQFEFRFRHADLFARFTFAHRARCAQQFACDQRPTSCAFLGIGITFDCVLFAFSFSHRALLAAATRARPAADIFPRFPGCLL